MRKSTATLLSTFCLISLLAGCSNKPADKSATATSTSTATSTGDATATATATATDTASSSTGSDKVLSVPGGTPAAGEKTGTAANPLATQPQTGQTPAGAVAGAPQVKINLNDLPGSLVICRVAGNKILVNDYKRMLRLQQIQMQTNLALDPRLGAGLLEQAKKANISLTTDEKSQLLAAAKAQNKGLTKANEKQFEDQVYNTGLALKAANLAVEQGILSQIVSRELLCKASQSAGLEKEANSLFAKVQSSKNFADLKKQTGLSQEDLKAELVKGELAKMQIAKLQKKVVVSDKEIKDWYEKNKKQLSHPERIRLATILIACPENDAPGIMSVRAQVKKANPKLDGKDLDTFVQNVVTQQQNRALILLGESQAAGVNFNKLANEKSDDLTVRNRKTGGDMGWQGKADLVPQFVDAVWPMKSGTILPKLVKTNEGFRIIKVTGHEPAGALPLKDVQPLIKAKLVQDKLGGVVNSWMADQQRIYRIDFDPEFLKVAQGAQTKSKVQ